VFGLAVAAVVIVLRRWIRARSMRPYAMGYSAPMR
jgi:hypothetical protein